MTKVIILGQQESTQEKKPIEFVKYLNPKHQWESNCLNPDHWDKIELIQKDYYGYDLMLAYHSDRNKGNLYLGHFNDGVV